MMDYDAMTYAFSPSVDSLAEFKVQTSTYSGEFGGAPGGQINMITKGGSAWRRHHRQRDSEDFAKSTNTSVLEL